MAGAGGIGEGAKQKHIMMVVPHISEDICEEILVRSSHESLITWKGVCKSWYKIITNELFVSRHLHRHSNTSQATTTATALVLLRPKSYGTILEPPKQHTVLELLKTQPLTLSWDDDDHGDYLRARLGRPNVIVGETETFLGHHCNGLVCFQHIYYHRNHNATSSLSSNDIKKIVLYNPTLRQCKILDQPNLSRCYYSEAAGFGYDRTSKAYKYVEIFQSPFDREMCAKVQICTLSSNGHNWREVERTALRLFCRRGVYFNSRYYWISDTGLVSFDMHDDKFGSTAPLPVRLMNRPADLSVWKGELVVLFAKEYTRNCVGDCYRMWVMMENDDGGKPYWKKYLKIGPFSSMHCLNFWSDEELLLIIHKTIVSYNIRTKRTRELRAPHFFCHLTFYSKSLVSFHPPIIS